MNIQALNAAKTAYQQADWQGAVSALNQVKQPGEVSGEADHLLGNALMKLGQYGAAAQAYASALQDASYGHVGALSCNCGRALVAAGSPEQAVQYFQAALNDPTYATPYKAHLALGNIYARSGMPREAGVAWRNAAIDESNPDPSSALVKLGGCFMQLGRPVDAIEAYRTALDFSSEGSQGAIYGDLGLAYMSSNRIAEASDAFGRACADPAYQLTAEQQASYTAAQNAMRAVSGSGPSETDQLLANAGYGVQGGMAFDPLDPMGKSGEFMPSPEDTGFFSVTEEDLMQADKAQRKHKRGGLKIFVTILIILLLVAAAGGFAYFKGYGWPTQESVVSDMFNAASANNDISPYLADTVSDETKSSIESILPLGSTVSISGVDRSMTNSTALATATLSSGGTQDYEVALVRSGISWKVTSVELSFASTVASIDPAATSESAVDITSSESSATTLDSEADSLSESGSADGSSEDTSASDSETTDEGTEEAAA